MQAQTSLQYKPLYSEKWGKKIQTARYNGTRTVCKNSSLIGNQKLVFLGNAVSMGPFGESARLFLLGLRPPIFGT